MRGGGGGHCAAARLAARRDSRENARCRRRSRRLTFRALSTPAPPSLALPGPSTRCFESAASPRKPGSCSSPALLTQKPSGFCAPSSASYDMDIDDLTAARWPTGAPMKAEAPTRASEATRRRNMVAAVSSDRGNGRGECGERAADPDRRWRPRVFEPAKARGYAGPGIGGGASGGCGWGKAAHARRRRHLSGVDEVWSGVDSRSTFAIQSV